METCCGCFVTLLGSWRKSARESAGRVRTYATMNRMESREGPFASRKPSALQLALEYKIQQAFAIDGSSH